MPDTKSSYFLPAAIVAAALLIAGAIYLTRSEDGSPTPTEEAVADITVRPVDASDHIRGNPNAPVLLVEYSDYDCPFCSQFHETMRRVMTTYGTEGNVAWVYRHFPIAGRHPNASDIAAASECVAELAGEDAFWTFTDLVFDEKPIESRNGQQYLGFTDVTRLTEFAERAGADPTRFELCSTSGKYDSAIADSVMEAQDAGATGTPYTLIIAGNEVVGTIPGAYPFENFRGADGQMQSGVNEIVSTLVEQLGAQAVPVAE